MLHKHIPRLVYMDGIKFLENHGKMSSNKDIIKEVRGKRYKVEM